MSRDIRVEVSSWMQLILVTPLTAGGENTNVDSCQCKVNFTLRKILIEIERFP